MNRRVFIQNACVATAGASLFWNCMRQYQKVNEIGVQLYTLRDDMGAAPVDTLKKLSKIGYKDVESAGYSEGTFYGMSPKEFKAVLDGEGLNVRSGHTQTGKHAPDQKGTMINDWEMAVANAAEIGQKYFILAYIHDFERQSIDDYKKLADLCNQAGEVCKKYDIQFGYHNHDFEFFDLDGEVPYDVLLANTDKDLMKMELDLYWIRKAQKDAVTYFNNHPGRFPLWHVKDMEDSEEKYFTEVGNGVIDWPSLFQAAEIAGMEHFYVEQDHCKNHKPIESVEISYKYLTAMEY
jgi:sugar phosphate isomerase/epimerase